MTKHAHTVPPCGFVGHYIFMSVTEPNIYFELTRQTNTFGISILPEPTANGSETPQRPKRLLYSLNVAMSLSL